MTAQRSKSTAAKSVRSPKGSVAVPPGTAPSGTQSQMAERTPAPPPGSVSYKS